MGQFTLLVAGMQFKEGPGFVVLAGNAVPGAELLLDSTCAVTHANYATVLPFESPERILATAADVH
jgi:hypothetical protein